MANSTFVSRSVNVTSSEKDYISAVNEKLKRDGDINPNSTLYQNALAQYNAGLAKGSIERLEIPKGFCGYIDPTSGEFRVKPEELLSPTVKNSILYPGTATNSNDTSRHEEFRYNKDLNLKFGLPGSPAYTNGSDGVDDGDHSCSGIKWPLQKDLSSWDKLWKLFVEALVLGITGKAPERTEEKTACGSGNGINSNTDLASASTGGGSTSVNTSNIPSKVFAAASNKALSLWPDKRTPEQTSAGEFPKGKDPGASYCGSVEAQEISKTNQIWKVYFNVNYPKDERIYMGFLVDSWIGPTPVSRTCGLEVNVQYNPITDNVISVWAIEKFSR